MSFTELLTLLVIRHKVMTLTEFYNANAIDLDVLASNIEEVERDAWERTRMMMWAILAPHTKKKQNPEELMKFSWEGHGSKGDQPLTTKEQFEQAFRKFKKV